MENNSLVQKIAEDCCTRKLSLSDGTVLNMWTTNSGETELSVFTCEHINFAAMKPGHHYWTFYQKVPGIQHIESPSSMEKALVWITERLVDFSFVVYSYRKEAWELGAWQPNTTGQLLTDEIKEEPSPPVLLMPYFKIVPVFKPPTLELIPDYQWPPPSTNVKKSSSLPPGARRYAAMLNRSKPTITEAEARLQYDQQVKIIEERNSAALDAAKRIHANEVELVDAENTAAQDDVRDGNQKLLDTYHAELTGRREFYARRFSEAVEKASGICAVLLSTKGGVSDVES